MSCRRVSQDAGIMQGTRLKLTADAKQHTFRKKKNKSSWIPSAAASAGMCRETPIHSKHKPFKAYRSRDAPTVQHSTTVRSAHTVFMCFVFI